MLFPCVVRRACRDMFMYEDNEWLNQWFISLCHFVSDFHPSSFLFHIRILNPPDHHHYHRHSPRLFSSPFSLTLILAFPYTISILFLPLRVSFISRLPPILIHSSCFLLSFSSYLFPLPSRIVIPFVYRLSLFFSFLYLTPFSPFAKIC